MGVFGNEYIIESKNKDKVDDEITNLLSIFFQHIAKWVFLPHLQTASWMNSIRNSKNAIRDCNSENHSAYIHYDLDKNKDTIDKIVVKELSRKNDISKFDLNFIYSYFDSLDKITDDNYVNNFVLNHRKNDKISVY